MFGFQFEILLNAAPLLGEGLLVTLGVSLSSFSLALAVGAAVGIARAESPRLR